MEKLIYIQMSSNDRGLSETVEAKPLVVDIEPFPKPLFRDHELVKASSTDCKVEGTDENKSLVTLMEEMERRGYLSGTSNAQKECDQELKKKSLLVFNAVEALTREATLISVNLEAEVVKLSLEIAKKILSHEAQIDRMFLAGAVRLAIDKFKATSEIMLIVAPEDISSWQQIMAEKPTISNEVSIVGSKSIQPGMCSCKVGDSKLDFSIDGQLAEISRRFEEIFATEHRDDRLYDVVTA